MANLDDKLIDLNFFTSRAQNPNPIGILQEFCQAFNLKFPVYDVPDKPNLDYGAVKKYQGSVSVFFNRNFLSSNTFTDKNKKELSKNAAADLWERICCMAVSGELGEYLQINKKQYEFNSERHDKVSWYINELFGFKVDNIAKAELDAFISAYQIVLSLPQTNSFVENKYERGILVPCVDRSQREEFSQILHRLMEKRPLSDIKYKVDQTRQSIRISQGVYDLSGIVEQDRDNYCTLPMAFAPFYNIGKPDGGQITRTLLTILLNDDELRTNFVRAARPHPSNGFLVPYIEIDKLSEARAAFWNFIKNEHPELAGKLTDPATLPIYESNKYSSLFEIISRMYNIRISEEINEIYSITARLNSEPTLSKYIHRVYDRDGVNVRSYVLRSDLGDFEDLLLQYKDEKPITEVNAVSLQVDGGGSPLLVHTKGLEYLTSQQVSERLGVDESWVEYMQRAGIISYDETQSAYPYQSIEGLLAKLQGKSIINVFLQDSVRDKDERDKSLKKLSNYKKAHSLNKLGIEMLGQKDKPVYTIPTDKIELLREALDIKQL